MLAQLLFFGIRILFYPIIIWGLLKMVFTCGENYLYVAGFIVGMMLFFDILELIISQTVETFNNQDVLNNTCSYVPRQKREYFDPTMPGVDDDIPDDPNDPTSNKKYDQYPPEMYRGPGVRDPTYSGNLDKNWGALLDTDRWTIPIPRPPICIQPPGNVCEPCPILSDPRVASLKEFNESLSNHAPQNINTKFIEERLNKPTPLEPKAYSPSELKTMYYESLNKPVGQFPSLMDP